MIDVLCRNRGEEFNRWKRVFDSHKKAHFNAGLRLKQLWQSIDDPNTVFFLFEAEDIERVQAFINDPESAETGKEAGILEGEIFYLKNLGG